MKNILLPKGNNINKVGMALKMYTKTIAQLTWVLFFSVKIANSYFSVALLNQEHHLIKMVSFVSVNIVLIFFFLKILKSKI